MILLKPGRTLAKARNRCAVSRNLKTIPKFGSEAEERRFWEKHDSTGYVDWGKAERVRLPNLKSSTTSISLHLPATPGPPKRR